MSIAQIHNSAMSFLNSLVGWTDVKFQIVTSTGNPITGTVTTVKNIPIRVLISKNESEYQKSDNTNNKEFKLCKVFVDDILEVNSTYNVNIPTDYNQIKQSVNIEISNGLKYQIKNAGSGSYNEKSLIVLEIERLT
jgi:hypothetical protein